jgi:hypothetical protein
LTCIPNGHPVPCLPSQRRTGLFTSSSDTLGLATPLPVAPGDVSRAATRPVGVALGGTRTSTPTIRGALHGSHLGWTPVTLEKHSSTTSSLAPPQSAPRDVSVASASNSDVVETSVVDRNTRAAGQQTHSQTAQPRTSSEAESMWGLPSTASVLAGELFPTPISSAAQQDSLSDTHSAALKSHRSTPSLYTASVSSLSTSTESAPSIPSSAPAGDTAASAATVLAQQSALLVDVAPAEVIVSGVGHARTLPPLPTRSFGEEAAPRSRHWGVSTSSGDGRASTGAAPSTTASAGAANVALTASVMESSVLVSTVQGSESPTLSSTDTRAANVDSICEGLSSLNIANSNALHSVDRRSGGASLGGGAAAAAADPLPMQTPALPRSSTPDFVSQGTGMRFADFFDTPGSDTGSHVGGFDGVADPCVAQQHG